MNDLIETESQFYGWIVEYLHRKGPFDLYPLLLREAAEQALLGIPRVVCCGSLLLVKL